jgi:hypothetical protein
MFCVLLFPFSPALGIIFLFKWDPSIKDERKHSETDDVLFVPQVSFLSYFLFPLGLLLCLPHFFSLCSCFPFPSPLAKIITNACATQAIINILLNRNDIDIGKDLQGFKDFCPALPLEVRLFLPLLLLFSSLPF